MMGWYGVHFFRLSFVQIIATGQSGRSFTAGRNLCRQVCLYISGWDSVADAEEEREDDEDDDGDITGGGRVGGEGKELEAIIGGEDGGADCHDLGTTVQ